MKENNNKKDNKSIWELIIENGDFLGGIFAVVALIAIIFEMAIAGFDNAAIASGVKDIAGTIVTVLVLFAFIPMRGFKFEKRMTKALEQWVSDNSNMLVHNKIMDGTDPDNKYGIGMRTDMNNYYSGSPSSNSIGVFVRLPKPDKAVYKNNPTIEFHLNKGTFFEGTALSKEELKQKYNILIEKFCTFITTKHNGFVSATGSGQIITVQILKPIKSNKDIEELINVLNSMMQAYLVAANIKL